MEKSSNSQSDSPIKTNRRGEFKVQFVDASEYSSNTRDNVVVASKPPEAPRCSSSGFRSNQYKASSSTSSSTGNLNSLSSSNSVSNKLNRSGSSGSSGRYKTETFGSTTSLDRRRQGSTSSASKDRTTTLQPLSKRTQSLDRRQKPLAAANDSSQERRRRNTHSHHDGRKSSANTHSPYANGNSYSNTLPHSYGESRNKSSSRPRTCLPNLNSASSNETNNRNGHRMLSSTSSFDVAHNHSSGNNTTTGTSSSSSSGGSSTRDKHDRDWLQRMKRAASRSPHRGSGSNKLSVVARDDNKDGKERASRRNEASHDRERGRSTHWPIPDHCSNDNL